MTLTSKITIDFEANYAAGNDIADAEQVVAFAKRVSLATGTGVGKADILFTDERTLAAGANEELDLAGVLADAFGATVAAAKLKAIIVVADDDNGGNIEIGGAASNAFVLFKDATDIGVVEAGCFFAQTFRTGRTVTAGTGDKLKMLNTDGAAGASYRLILVCASV